METMMQDPRAALDFVRAAFLLAVGGDELAHRGDDAG
jgi:hypothetical protein